MWSSDSRSESSFGNHQFLRVIQSTDWSRKAQLAGRTVEDLRVHEPCFRGLNAQTGSVFHGAVKSFLESQVSASRTCADPSQARCHIPSNESPSKPCKSQGLLIDSQRGTKRKAEEQQYKGSSVS